MVDLFLIFGGSKGENKKETGNRRRNLSGSRPLSSFIDTLDPFVLLGLEKFENGQVLYVNLYFSSCRWSEFLFIIFNIFLDDILPTITFT